MTVIGIDVGGTTIKGAAVTDNGRIFKSFCLPVSKEEKGEDVLKDLAAKISEYIESNKDEIGPISGIGMGIPGVIDSKNGIVCHSVIENIPFSVYLFDSAMVVASIAGDKVRLFIRIYVQVCIAYNYTSVSKIFCRRFACCIA